MNRILGDPSTHAQLKWAAFTVLALCVLLGFASALHLAIRSVDALRLAQVTAKTIAPVILLVPDTSGVSTELFGSLAQTDGADTLTLFTSKIAREQGLSLVRIQSEIVSPNVKILGRTRFNLEVHGDYLSTKNLLIAILKRFPGMTLERLMMRHRALTTNFGADPTGRSDDETTIELIQYSRPPKDDE